MVKVGSTKIVAQVCRGHVREVAINSTGETEHIEFGEVYFVIEYLRDTDIHPGLKLVVGYK